MTLQIGSVHVPRRRFITPNTPYGSDPPRLHDFDDCVDIARLKSGPCMILELLGTYAPDFTLWDSKRSVFEILPYSVDNIYRCRVWDITTRTYVEQIYPEGELEPLAKVEDMGGLITEGNRCRVLPAVMARHVDGDAIPEDVAEIARAVEAGGVR